MRTSMATRSFSPLAPPSLHTPEVVAGGGNGNVIAYSPLRRHIASHHNEGGLDRRGYLELGLDGGDARGQAVEARLSCAGVGVVVLAGSGG